jgi:hypothetical protein
VELEQKETKELGEGKEKRMEEELVLVRFRDGREKWVRKERIRRRYDYTKDEVQGVDSQ